MKVYIAFADAREENGVILGVYGDKKDALRRVGKYNRDMNTKDDLGKNVKLSDLALGQASLNQFSCIIGYVEEQELF